jgi:hypothetical protein
MRSINRIFAAKKGYAIMLPPWNVISEGSIMVQKKPRMRRNVVAEEITWNASQKRIRIENNYTDSLRLTGAAPL